MTPRADESTLTAMLTVESRIDRVTVYSSGARVRRVARVAGPIPATVRFSDLPLVLADDSVRAEVPGGGAIVSAIRTEVAVGDDEVAAPERSPEVTRAERKVALVETEIRRLTAALEQLAAAALVTADPSDDPPAKWHDVVAARRALANTHRDRDRSLREQLAAAMRDHVALRRELDAIVERDRRAGTAKPARAHEPRKQIELALVASPGASGDAKGVDVVIEYVIPVARWAPSYVARFDGDNVRVEMRAVVAQTSGEDWLGAGVRVSTAEPERFAELPELAAQKIGRRQDEPGKRGFRAPPEGGEALFADYDLAFPSPNQRFGADSVYDDSTYTGKPPQPPPLLGGAPMRKSGTAAPPKETWDDAVTAVTRSFDETRREMARQISAPAAAPSMPAPGAMAYPMQSYAAPQAAGGGGAPDLGGMPRGGLTAPPPPPVPRLDYGNLVMAMPSSPQRGRLVPTPHPVDPEVTRRIGIATQSLALLDLPPGCIAQWADAYDYAYDADGKVDITSDGAWHSIPITSGNAAASIRHVCVPREQLDVFRVATLTNPFAGPLLAGPIDVYDRGHFVLASHADTTPAGASVDIGLGVDAAIKVARNTEFREETTGMLRGALRLHHAIIVDVDNLSARGIELEVRERIPVTREGDDDVEVIPGRVEPAWERWTPDPDAPRDQRLRGGHRWRVSVPAGAKRTLRAAYEVKIANKLEIVGGNRRES